MSRKLPELTLTHYTWGRQRASGRQKMLTRIDLIVSLPQKEARSSVDVNQE